MKQQTTDSEKRSWPGAMLFHGWLGLTLWMTFGLLLESLMAYKSPGYLGDPQRRELFRLAHAHGTLLHLILVAAAFTGRRELVDIPRLARGSLRIGVVVLPLGFLLGGAWHPEGDPGLAIWLVPVGALMAIFGGFATALACREARRREKAGPG